VIRDEDDDEVQATRDRKQDDTKSNCTTIAVRRFSPLVSRARGSLYGGGSTSSKSSLDENVIENEWN
jgi:hypothetical protein